MNQLMTEVFVEQPLALPGSAKNPASKAKFAERKKPFSARQFYTLYKEKFPNLRPLLSITFLQGFRKSKRFGHCNSGKGGAKRHLNGVNK